MEKGALSARRQNSETHKLAAMSGAGKDRAGSRRS